MRFLARVTALLLVFPAIASADTITAAASLDATLYENATGAVANGNGERFFAGKTDLGLIRRSLVQFNLSAIPAGSTIQSVTLRLYMSRTTASTQQVTVHRVLASWGEGASNAGAQEGAGVPSQANDATWIHRFYPNVLWTAAGGDFDPSVRASAAIGNTGTYDWTSTGLRDDVQAWLNAPSTNFGWLLKDAEGTDHTAKRFESRTGQSGRQPALIVIFTPPAGTGGCNLPNGTCETMTAAQCSAAGGTFLGIGVPCPPPTGACVLPNGTCEVRTAAECSSLGGNYLGNGAACPPPTVNLTPWVDPLPRPGVATPTAVIEGVPHYQLRIQQFQQQLHRDLPPTTVWGFEGSYPGPTIEALRGQPIAVTWVNDLRNAQGQYLTEHYLPVDTCLRGPDKEGATPRTVVHLHGGHVPPESDGYPEHTFLPGASAVYHYPNAQNAATLWYHDHAMGITRLNVYMGLAGFYLVRDAVETALGLPAGEFEVPLAIQDRAFNIDGSLKYPALWEEHFYGDHILVNGKVWPYLQVKQGRYRFRLLNGSGSRTYRLSLSNGAGFHQIGTDGGLLAAPVALNEVTLLPGERADVVIDFSSYSAGTEIVLTNSAPIHFPGVVGDGVIPNVLKFIVTAATGHTAPLPATLRPVEALMESSAVEHRQFQLLKVADPCTGSRWAINGYGWHDLTEFPVLNTTEVWSFINRSGISHPMHMHLIFFQVLDRQPFTMNGDEIVPTGPPVPPPPNEAGWKDTVAVPPWEIVRVIARFEGYTGHYAYHCHILEHEDHEMMRQFVVVPPPEVLSLGFGAKGFSLTFKPAPHRLHTVEWKATLDALSWQPLTTGLTSEVPISITDPAAVGLEERFYRVRVEPSTARPPHDH